MYGNKLESIIVPQSPGILYKLEILNLGYNDLAYLPDDLDRLTALRVLKVMNNFLERVPMRVCNMNLRSLDVTSNPVIQPPIDTCERGIAGMKRYYRCLRREEESKQRALADVQSKTGRKIPAAEQPSSGLVSSVRMRASASTASRKSNAPPQPAVVGPCVLLRPIHKTTPAGLGLPDLSNVPHVSCSDHSTRSLLYGKTRNTGPPLVCKSFSLIFPDGVESYMAMGDSGNDRQSSGSDGGPDGMVIMGGSCGHQRLDASGTGEGGSSDDGIGVDPAKRRRINILLDQCESARFTFKKKLALNNLNLTAADIPLKDLCGTPLGDTLNKLSIIGNQLGTVPARLMQNLPALKHLDLSQCQLQHLPDRWNLPQLKRLNLSHNKLTDFLDEVRV
jgi:Leucine-rich repeat (LRR) protein